MFKLPSLPPGSKRPAAISASLHQLLLKKTYLTHILALQLLTGRLVMLLALSASERDGTTSPRRDLQARVPFICKGATRSELVQNSWVSVPRAAFGHEGGRPFSVFLTPLPVPLSCGVKLPCKIKRRARNTGSFTAGHVLSCSRELLLQKLMRCSFCLCLVLHVTVAYDNY